MLAGKGIFFSTYAAAAGVDCCFPAASTQMVPLWHPSRAGSSTQAALARDWQIHRGPKVSYPPFHPPKHLTSSWWLAVGSWRLAVGTCTEEPLLPYSASCCGTAPMHIAQKRMHDVLPGNTSWFFPRLQGGLGWFVVQGDTHNWPLVTESSPGQAAGYMGFAANHGGKL